MFMWAQAAKEANRYEANYRESMQMIINEAESANGAE
jgi:hypothetical protein